MNRMWGFMENAFPLALPDERTWRQACALRGRYWGEAVFLRGIIEVSNYCKQNCLYCGLRRDNAKLARYRLAPETIVAAVADIVALGIGSVVLQSGEDAYYDGPALAGIVSAIKRRFGLAVTLCVGERDVADYALWREAGADRYLLKMETFDESLHARLRPGCSPATRLRAFERLAALDYETGTGLIVGLPGETPALAEQDMDALTGAHADMISISPFVPHPDTPLGAHPACPPETALHRMALARIALPAAHIPVTSALGLHGDALRIRGLQVGDVLMPSLTPANVRAAYAVYPGKNASAVAPLERAAAMKAMLLEHGFSLPSGPGEAWRKSARQDRIKDMP
jgi:biotin synthase